ncbi:hypothetical protein QZH56_29225 [Streptomyces olivoreticuli]|uniref:DUF4190 domain-containing protein n=1 Tax=Streptomyces blastmyceticus TaxID=68180 RepID=A0ABP3HRV7_9ACTN|nr:hypothetical protein [Streptomyces olivoreticuli]WKK22801.1 hypothetical protein QZH56_29225 [Streptomyces olivoreticuli]
MTSSTQQTAAPTAGARNTPARIAFWSAACGVGLIVAIFATPMLWLLYAQYYTFFTFVFGAVAIPAGHLGRFRSKRLGGRDRGLALLAIVTGWLLLFYVLLAVLAYGGLIVGLTFLFGSAK